MKRLVPAIALLAAALLAAPRAGAGQDPAEGGRVEVAAAANLKGAAEELKRAFEAERPWVQVSLTLGASGTFFAQIQNGAPFDLFLSADRDYPQKLVLAGLGSEETVYALGKLVAWLPPGSTLDLERRGLAALADPAVRRIALAKPAVAPFGRAAEAALRAAGVHQAVKGKLVLGNSAAQAAQFATSGAADVAFLPLSLTLGKELSSGKVVPVDEKLYPRIEQSGVLLSRGRAPGAARAFLAFIAGPRGRAILAKQGYGLP